MDARAAIDVALRQKVLDEVITKMLEEWSFYSQDPLVQSKIKDLSLKFEQKVFEYATSKDDYIAKIFQRLMETRSKFVTILAPQSIGNPLMNADMLRQVHHQDIGQQNVSFQRDLQHPLMYQKNMSVQEPILASNSMLNMDRGQRSVVASHQHQINNAQAQQMLHQPSSTDLLQQLVSSQRQRNQFHDSRTQGSQIPAPHLHSQYVSGEKKYTMASQMAVAETTSAPSSSPAAEASNVAAWQSLLTQFRLMRLKYLPEVFKLQEKAKDQHAHAQTVDQRQINIHAMAVLGRMSRFLKLTERELIALPKDKVVEFMNKITQFVAKNSTGIQALQLSSSRGQQQLQNTPVNSGDQNLLSSMFQVPQRTLQLGNPQNLPEKADNLLLQPVTNATSRFCKPNIARSQFSGNSSHPLPSIAPQDVQPMVSTKVPQFSSLLDKKEDTLYLSDPGATSEPETSMFRFDPPMNPSTPSSVPKKISKPDESFLHVSSPKENVDSQTGASKNHVETTKVLDQSTSHAEPGISVATSQPDLTGSESKQLLQSPKRPIDRLVEAVQSASHENLTSSVNDIFSAIDNMDRLAAIAFEDELQWNMHMEMECFLGSTQEMGDNNDGHIPATKMRRHFISTSRDVSMTSDNDDSMLRYPSSSSGKSCLKRSRSEPSVQILGEIRTANQRLDETRAEVVSGSREDAGSREASKGTVIRCTYKAVAISDTLKRHPAFATALAPLQIEFLVPSDYPNSFPEILDKLPEDCGNETKELSEKIKSRFNRCVRSLEHPISLGDMAKAWDDSARTILSEFALFVRGGAKA